MSSTKARHLLAGRSLYLCTPDRPDLESFVASCIDGGVDIVQLREKFLEAKQLVARARVVMNVCAASGVPFILNDRPDLALDIGADGVHVGQDDASPELARRLLGSDCVIGLSTHQSCDLAGALNEPVDYISVGPVVATPTKPGRDGTGEAYVQEAAASTASWTGGDGAALPFFITGGVTPENITGLAASGANRFVVVRYLTESTDPKASARALRQAIDSIG